MNLDLKKSNNLKIINLLLKYFFLESKIFKVKKLIKYLIENIYFDKIRLQLKKFTYIS
jgi:hypothetical protein